MTTKKIPTPDKRKRAVRNSVGYRIHLWVPADLEEPIKQKAKETGAPSISEWVRRLIHRGLGDPT